MGDGSQSPDELPPPHPRSDLPELRCLRRVLPPMYLANAAARARDLGIGADRVLIQDGIIDEVVYLQHLARETGLATENFTRMGDDSAALLDSQIRCAAQSGILPLRDTHGGLSWVIAPRNLGARYIGQHITAQTRLVGGDIRLATNPAFDAFLQERSGPGLADDAANGLRQRQPHLSAAPRNAHPSKTKNVMRLAAAFGLPLIPFTIAFAFDWLDVLAQSLALMLLLCVVMRAAAALIPAHRVAELPRLRDDALPIYTIIVALYHEARSVPLLMDALTSFDYPREKLDIIFVVEPDDLATRAAIARVRTAHPGRMNIVRTIVAPTSGPKTKPKALNAALPFARGSFTAVYDAEDRPCPGQLRAALDAFRSTGPDLACAQASLCIDNGADGWLAAMFTAEYAGQFDVFLPGLSRLNLPLPLGGSSNHFRTDILRAVGAWDAWNVTEDADLGFRLARFGYRSTAFASTTGEEAPFRPGAWLRQRSRWMKGWMQTWAVHMRAPFRFWRDAGGASVVALNVIVGGSVLTALACPLLIVGIGWHLWRVANSGVGFLEVPAIHIATFATAICATIAVGLIGLTKRRLLRHAWVLAAMPLYWIYLSIAAWRAWFQFWTDRYHWEKTEHGVAKSRANATPEPAETSSDHKYRLRSDAASSGLRLMLNGAMKRPSRSIR